MKTSFTIINKSLVLILAMVMTIISITNPINAEDYGTIHVDENGITYLEDSQGFFHYYYDAFGNQISFEEAQNNLNRYAPIIVPYNSSKGPVKYNTAEYYSHTQINGTRTKITPDVTGPATISYGNSISTTASWNYAFNVSMKAKIITEINLNVGISYTDSSTSDTSFGMTYSVPTGKIGSIYFTPYKKKAYIKTWDESGVYKLAIVTYPVKLSTGFTDGLYELVLR